MSSKKSLWKSLKKSLPKSSALFCRICGNETFTLLRAEGSDHIALECKGCYRGYLLQGQDLLIGEPVGPAKKGKGVRWDWSKTDWVPQ